MSSDLDPKHLAKLLGMLGSDHDGEALNAARAAQRLLWQHGATWEQVLAPPPISPARTAPRNTWAEPNYSWSRPGDHVTSAKECIDSPAYLSAWELGFLESMVFKFSCRSLTDKQEAVLDRICSKCGVWR